MMHRVWAGRVFALALVAMCLTAAPSRAQEGRIRVAVVDFDTEGLAGNSWKFSWSAHNLARAASDGLTSELVKTGRFRVIERQQLNKVIAEQNLGSGGAVDPSTAAKIGKILGVQLVVMGSVTQFEVSDFGGNVPQLGRWKGLGGIGGSVITGKAAVTVRVVDTTTAEILGAYDGRGTHRFAKGEYAGASLGTEFNSGMAAKVLAEALQEAAAGVGKSAANLTPSTPRGGLEGKLARVDGSRIYVNLGAASGVKPGDRFEVRHIGEQIKDPDTGEVLGGDETVVGQIEIVKLINDRLSEARSVSGDGFAVGDRAVMK